MGKGASRRQANSEVAALFKGANNPAHKPSADDGFLSENICFWTKIHRLLVKKTKTFVPKQCFGRSNMFNILDNCPRAKTFIRRLRAIPKVLRV
jgi:hypothetical protein